LACNQAKLSSRFSASVIAVTSSPVSLSLLLENNKNQGQSIKNTCCHDPRLSFTGIHYILGAVESISHPVMIIDPDIIPDLMELNLDSIHPIQTVVLGVLFV
jgi:hypothetical protein